MTGDLGAVTVSSGIRILQPGYYSGGITVSGTGCAIMQTGRTGVYVLGGVGLRVNGSGAVVGNVLESLSAQGVTVYIVGTGQLILNSSAKILMTPPTIDVPSAGQVSGLVIFQPSSNSQTATIVGAGQTQIDGTLYLPSAALNVTGQGDTFGSEFIVNSLTITGNVSLNPDGPIPAAQSPTTYLGR